MALAGALALAVPLCVSAPGNAHDQPERAPAAEADGPYVLSPGAGAWQARSIDREGRSVSLDRSTGDPVSIPAVGDVPAFAVELREPPSPAPSQQALDADVPLLVLADTHGEYAILVEFLRRQGIVDPQLRWSFGRGHLAVTGDMVDRGAHQTEILWLLYKLEQEARDAGGAVHVLIGNHEAMLLRGDERYLNPRYKDVASFLGAPSYSALFGPDTLLGQWLRTRPAMFKLGDLLLLHGGVSLALTGSDLTLDRINAAARRHLDMPAGSRPPAGSADALVAGPEGPLWYRGYFALDDKPAAASAADVAAALGRFGVSRILVGHTIVETVQPLYGGKVIAVQVYPHRDAASGRAILEAALRLDGIWYRATAQGERIPLEDRP